MSAWPTLALLSAAGMPAVKFAVGYNNSNCEAHPHAGVQLQDGGWLMVGDSQCWDGSAPYKRGVFVVATEPDGDLRWSMVLGDLGFNYGKYGSQLSDGTVVVGGSKSIHDADAASAGFAYIESRALWRLDVRTGRLLSETTFPNAGKMSGLRDGIMCVTPTTDGTNALVATGYVGGEANWDGHDYDDEPMFLIFNGRAFAARLSYSTDDLSAPAAVDWVTDLGLDASYGYVPMQGMRIHMMEAAANTVAVSAASCSGPVRIMPTRYPAHSSHGSSPPSLAARDPFAALSNHAGAPSCLCRRPTTVRRQVGHAVLAARGACGHGRPQVGEALSEGRRVSPVFNDT